MELSFKDFEEGRKFELGAMSLSEQEIIDFAKTFDPLDIHINREIAEKGYFKGIIASGSHLFTIVHRDKWISSFKHTVICGLELNHWKFIKPIYPDQKIYSTVTITSIKPNPEKGHATITWLYEFKNEMEEIVQSLEMVVLHKID